MLCENKRNGEKRSIDETNLKNLHEDKDIWIFQVNRMTLGYTLRNMLNEDWTRYGCVVSHSQLNLVLPLLSCQCME